MYINVGKRRKDNDLIVVLALTLLYSNLPSSSRFRVINQMMKLKQLRFLGQDLVGKVL